MTKKDKVTVDDIIGLVDCEPTNSVEEVRKLRGRTNERFMVDTAGTLIDMETRDTFDYVSDVCPLLNELTNELTLSKTVIGMKRQQINSLKTENEALNSRITYLERKINRERTSHTKQDTKWQTEAEEKIRQLAKVNREGVEKVQKLSYENEQLKKENQELKLIIRQNNFAKEEGFE